MRRVVRTAVQAAFLALACLSSTRVDAQQQSERELNALGYRLLGQHKLADAVAVFQQVVARFPGSANAYDSLGDGLAAAGQRTDAAAAYEEAHRRDTTNTRARELTARLRDARRAERWTNIVADAAVRMDTIELRSGTDRLRAYVARPVKAGRYPAVVVIHANRLMEPYIASTTQMLARAGFAAIAVDVFHFLPGNASWESAALVPGDSVSAVILREFSEARLLRNLQSGIDYLHKQPYVAAGGAALLGFCGGGWSALIASAQLKDVGALVAFYSSVNIMDDPKHRAPVELASYIRVPVQFHRALNDHIVDVPAVTTFAEQLRAQGTTIEVYDYPADHGFFAWNRHGPFSEIDADVAWSRIVPFLRANAGKPLRARVLAPAPATRTSPRARATQHAILHSGH